MLRILLSIGPTETMHFQTWQDKAGNAPPLTDPTTGLTFPDLNGGGELLKPNLIMPEPTIFLDRKFPICSIIRPTETAGAAVGAAKGLAARGLFNGTVARVLRRRHGARGGCGRRSTSVTTRKQGASLRFEHDKGRQMIENILSPTHLLLILAVALVVLGPKRLPEAGRGLGSAIRGFKDWLVHDRAAEEQASIQTSLERDRARRSDRCGRDPDGSVSATSSRSRRAPHDHRAPQRAAARLLLGVAVLAVLFAGCLWQSRALLRILNVPLAELRDEFGGAGFAGGQLPQALAAAPAHSADSRTRPRSPRPSSGPR